MNLNSRFVGYTVFTQKETHESESLWKSFASAISTVSVFSINFHQFSQSNTKPTVSENTAKVTKSL